MKLFHITFIFVCAMLTMGKIQSVAPTEAENKEEADRLQDQARWQNLRAAAQPPIIAPPPAQQIMPEMQQPVLPHGMHEVQLAALTNVHIHNLRPPAPVIPMEQPQVAPAPLRANGIKRNIKQRCGQVLDCHYQVCLCLGPGMVTYPCWLGPVLATVQCPCITAYVCCSIKAAKKGIFYCWNDEYR